MQFYHVRAAMSTMIFFAAKENAADIIGRRLRPASHPSLKKHCNFRISFCLYFDFTSEYSFFYMLNVYFPCLKICGTFLMKDPAVYIYKERTMKKCAVIDIGSNTIRLSAFQYEGDNIQPLMNRKMMAGLASYVKDGALTDEGIHMTCRTLETYKDMLKNLDISDYHVFATASLRNVSNTYDVLKEIENETGIRVAVISGEDEGMLSLRGAIESVELSSGLLVDLGGGSTEIVPFKNKRAKQVCSLKAGSLNLYKKFVEDFLPTKEERNNISSYYESLIEEGGVSIPKSEVICGVGGTFRAIAKLIDYVTKRPEGTCEFTDREIDDLYKFLKKGDREAKDLLLKVCPDRVHTVIPGIIAVRVIMKKALCREVKVSRTGVREGYLFSRVLHRDIRN